MAQIGDRIGPFELVERVRRGRCTSVFRGARRDTLQRAPREVALRVADGGPEGCDPALLEALRQEYETLRLLADERIPGASALYAGHGAVALQWVHAAPLRASLRLVEDGRIDLDATTSVDILVELAYALRHAHALVREEGRIVHGTLSADVVALTPTGGVVLHGFADPDPTHTWPLAPEQQHDVQDPRTDQWLLGALGIELLRHAPEVLGPARGAPIDVAYGLIQAQWPAAARILGRMLAEDPAQRYESEERLIKELLALSRGLGGVSRRAEVGARTAQLEAEVASEPIETDAAPPARAAPARAPAVDAPPPPTLIERTPSPTPAGPLPLDGEAFLPSTWPRFDAPRTTARPPAVAPAVRAPLPEPPRRASVPSSLPRPTPVARVTAPVEPVVAPVQMPFVMPAVQRARAADNEVTIVEMPLHDADAEETFVREALEVGGPADGDAAGDFDLDTLPAEAAEPERAPPPIQLSAAVEAPDAAAFFGTTVEVEEEDTGAEQAPAVGHVAAPAVAPAAGHTVAPAAADVAVADTAADTDTAAEDPFAERPDPRDGRPSRPADDPVPDQWVVGSIAVFAVVAVLAAAWSLA